MRRHDAGWDRSCLSRAVVTAVERCTADLQPVGMLGRSAAEPDGGRRTPPPGTEHRGELPADSGPYAARSELASPAASSATASTSSTRLARWKVMSLRTLSG